MAEQRVSWRTIYGWLSVLGAITELTGTGEAPKLTKMVSFPVAVIDLVKRSCILASPRLAELLGLGDDDVQAIDLHLLVENPSLLDSLMDLLIEGSIDAFQARRTLRRADGRTIAVELWVAMLDGCERHRAVHVVIPVEETLGRPVPTPTLAEWPDRVTGLAIGTFDAEWRVERMSVDAETLLGVSVDEIVGSSFVQMVHPDDVHDLLRAVAQSLVDQGGVGVELRLRGRSDTWFHSKAIITPLAGKRPSFGFAIAAAPQNQQRDSAPRVVELERHLWRIAQEVEASGVAAGLSRVPDLNALPGLAELSGRQWQVLTRLIRGERVPTIASELYVSQSTVRNQLSQIFRKLRVHWQADLPQVLRADKTAASGGRRM